ncbi:MAG: glycosyltransferase [Chryseolinea sp.]
MDLIWFSLDRVENKYSSTSFSLAKELARNNRVFYVDNPITYSEAYKAKSSDKKNPSHSQTHLVSNTPENFISIKPSMTLPINWMSNGGMYRWASQINNSILNNSLQKLISDYALKDFVFVNVFNPFYARTFSPKVKPALSVYYSVDDIRYSPYVKKHGPLLEQEIAKSYDVTLTTSRELQSILKEFSSSVYCLPNAADIALFKTALSKSLEKPEDIKNITNPIILYTGHVDWRVDIDMLTTIAKRHSDKTLLLVGPVSLKDDVIELLKSIPNIVFTGSKKLELLPAYLQHAKCAIIPFKCNTLTKSIYPLKINEYLAAGLPVVSTSFSEDIRQFNDVIHLEDDGQEFARKIQLAIDEDSNEKKVIRSKASESNSWAARAESFWQIMNRHLKK